MGAATCRSTSAYGGPLVYFFPRVCRQLVCEKGLLTRASGSVRWKQGGTEVLAALHGPQPALQRKAQADRAVVEINLRPRSGLPGVLPET